MAAVEDCASVLEQFVHDAANLNAEISHMMEEIQAKDSEMNKSVTLINNRDSAMQKHIKAQGSAMPHPKEAEYDQQIKKNYDMCLEMQKQKMVLSEKACTLLDGQLKKLDRKIRDLQKDGQLNDTSLPSVFNARKAELQKPVFDMGPTMPLQAMPINAINQQAHRLNAQTAAGVSQPIPRQIPQMAAMPNQAQRPPVPTSPAAALQQQQQRQRDRETSQGAETKRRKLNASLGGINLPAQSSNLRQSSLGPGTPKAGTPTGTSRAGSVPRSITGQSTVLLDAKNSLTKKALPQAVNKLKKKHARLSFGRKKGQSPSVRVRGGTAASEEDSVLSSAEPSDTDASQSRARRKKTKTEAREESFVDEAMEEDENEDHRKYCYCQELSHGEMVACENDKCPYQWFHTACLKMKKVPDEDEDWYCPTCRKDPAVIEMMNKKKRSGIR